MITATVTGAVAIATIGALASKFGLGRDYSTLFIGLNQEEAQQVVALSSGQGVDYRFNSREEAIRVSFVSVNQTRAELLSMGYPESGSPCGAYRNNIDLMTMESDKEQYTLHELQDRLGAQICLLNGIQDVRVTIAKAEEPVYTYGDNTEVEASASIVATMTSGRSLSDNGAVTIKNLIAMSVREMNFINVAVFDADTMMEVGGRPDDEDYGSVKDVTTPTSLVENNMATNVCRVPEKLYGQGKTTVSIKGTLSIEKLIQENTRYTVPEEIDEQGRTGLLYKEGMANENSGAAVPGNGGVVGTDVSMDTPRYTNQNGTQTSTDLYTNSSAAREWLYDSVKEQRQVNPGVLGDTTIGIMIDTNGTSIPVQDLINLVADPVGISREEARQEITIIRALSSSGQAATQPVAAASAQIQARSFSLPIIIAVITGGILILLLFMPLLVGRKRRERDSSDDAKLTVESASGEKFPSAPAVETGLDMQYRDEGIGKGEQILNLRMQHSPKLKQNIDGLADQNPQIAAKLVQGWLRGEGDLSGGKHIGELNSK